MLVAPSTGLGADLVLPGGRSYEGTNGLVLETGHISVTTQFEWAIGMAYTAHELADRN